MIDKATVQRITDAADIVEVVSDYVHLTRRGANFMGLCPFHNERTPSFSVNRRKNFCYCFSCHKGGSPVNFIMEKEGISYHDALLQLAAKYGIEVHERELSDAEKEAQNERDAMFVANAWAMEVMQQNLHDTEEGRNIGMSYFYERGLTDEAIRAFRLGYALDRGNALTTRARSEGYDVVLLQKLGLVGVSHQDNRPYDRFRGRVIYPVFTTSGKVVAFGGRTLKGEKAKYINSPESVIYTKSNELYGLFQAKNAIGRTDKCFLVEGYMDVIGMWQAGLQNVVASSGTALTEQQIALIHRFTSNITLLYDGDNAGIKAALRGIDMLLAHRMNVKVLLLPDGHDPDSFAREKTPEEFQQYVADHETDVVRFKTEVLLKDCAGDPQRRAQAVRSIVTTLAHIQDNITRTIYIGECARLLSVSEEVIAIEVRRAREQAVAQATQARQREAINAQRQGDTTPSHPGLTPHRDTTPATHTSPTAPPRPKDTLTQRLESAEREVLRYCVRYGMLYFCDGVDDDGQNVDINLCEYVRDELQADSIDFSVDVYRRIFSLLLEMKQDFGIALTNFTASLAPKYAALRQQRYDEMAERQLSIPEMEAAERTIEQELTDMEHDEMDDFARLWPGQQLASHEQDSVRSVTNALITDQYSLSRVYTRQGHLAREYDNLDERVPRAILEWKDAILRMRQQTLGARMAEAAAAGNDNEAERLQQEYAHLIELRSQVAKNIGDRIISPT